MRQIKINNNFKKHLRKVSQNPKFKKTKYTYLDVLDMLAKGETLPAELDDHPAARTSPQHLQGTNIIHLSPNICMVYKLDGDTVYAVDIGSHQDLFEEKV